jgi:hypothetical protein
MTATEATDPTVRKPPPWIEKAEELSRFHWSDRWLPLDELVTFRLGETENGFQRPLQERRVQYLVDHFDAGEARVIFVSRREKPDGSVEYVILDGQHTAEACRRVTLTHWACRIFYGMTLEDEASHFIEYQANSRKIPGVVQHNAEVIASSPEAVAIENILRPFYLRISTAKLRSEEGFIPIASRAMFEKLLAISPAVLREVLQLCVDAWGHNRESFNSRIMSGLGYLLATAYTSSGQAPFDRQRMLAVLKNTTPKQIEEKIGPTGSGGAQKSGAAALLDLYLEGAAPGYTKINSRAKTSPQLPDKFNIKKDYVEHDFWTAESIDYGRTKVTPYVAPPAPEPKPRGRRRTAVNEEAPGVASSNGSEVVVVEAEVDVVVVEVEGDLEARKAALIEGGTVPLAEAATVVAAAAGAVTVPGAVPEETDDDWNFNPAT